MTAAQNRNNNLLYHVIQPHNHTCHLRSETSELVPESFNNSGFIQGSD